MSEIDKEGNLGEIEKKSDGQLDNNFNKILPSSREKFQENVIHSDPFYDLFVNKIVVEVEDRVRKDQARNLNRLSIFGGLIGAALLGAAAFFHSTLVQRAAEEAVTSRLGELEGKIEVADLSLQLTEVINDIEQGQSFSNAQQNAALRLLTKASELDNFRERSSFIPQLESLTLSFAAADVGTSIDAVDDLYRKNLQQSSNIVGGLALHYGMRLLRTPDAPSDWNESPFDDLYARYLHYVHSAKSNGYPETYVLFEMLREHMLYKDSQETNDRAVMELIAEIDDLGTNDLDNFWNMLDSLKSTDWPQDKLAQYSRISKNVDDFLETYKHEREKFKVRLNEIKTDGDADSESNFDLASFIPFRLTQIND